MIEILQTAEYERWFKRLSDRTARVRINTRIRRVSLGNFGDTKQLESNLFELRITYGPGYRIYFMKEGTQIIILLAGGEKSKQERDIIRAREIATKYREI